MQGQGSEEQVMVFEEKDREKNQSGVGVVGRGRTGMDTVEG